MHTQNSLELNAWLDEATSAKLAAATIDHNATFITHPDDGLQHLYRTRVLPSRQLEPATNINNQSMLYEVFTVQFPQRLMQENSSFKHFVQSTGLINNSSKHITERTIH